MGITLKKATDTKKHGGKLDFFNLDKTDKMDFNIQIITADELKKKRNSAYTYIIP